MVPPPSAASQPNAGAAAGATSPFGGQSPLGVPPTAAGAAGGASASSPFGGAPPQSVFGVGAGSAAATGGGPFQQQSAASTAALFQPQAQPPPQQPVQATSPFGGAAQAAGDVAASQTMPPHAAGSWVQPPPQNQPWWGQQSGGSRRGGNGNRRPGSAGTVIRPPRRERQTGAPQRTYATCNGCKGWLWHDLIPVDEPGPYKCHCGHRWPQADLQQARHMRQFLLDEWQQEASSWRTPATPPGTTPRSSRPPSPWNGWRERGGRGADGAPHPAYASTQVDAVGAALAVMRQAQSDGMLTGKDGNPLELPAEVVITAIAPEPPVAQPAPREAKHLAEVECQRTSKQQRLALEAVRAAEQEVEHARQRLASKENILTEAKAALAQASAEAEQALLAFNTASKEYQAEVARAAAPDAAKSTDGSKDAGKDGNHSRSSSRDGGKRAAPAERTEVSAAWESFKANVADALATGNHEAAKELSQRHMDDIIRLQQEALDAHAAAHAASQDSTLPAAGNGAPALKRTNTGVSAMDVGEGAGDGARGSGLGEWTDVGASGAPPVVPAANAVPADVAPPAIEEPVGQLPGPKPGDAPRS